MSDRTGGFYRVSDPAWSRFARQGEGIVCDPCMSTDPKYRAEYRCSVCGHPKHGIRCGEQVASHPDRVVRCGCGA